MKTKILSFIMVFVICSITVYSQSIVNGGSGQGMINLVTDNGFVPKNGFKNIKPDGSLGFWRLRILPERLSTALQEIQVAYEFSIDRPTTIRGYNANGGEIFYDPADFQITITGSMDFVIKGHYTDPTTGKQHTFEDKRYISKLGNTVTKGALFTYGPETISAMVKLKEITREAITLEVFLQKFKVQVTSIEAVSRNYSGFSDLDIKIGRMLDKKREDAKFNTLLADAQNAESFGRMDEAIQKYEDAYKIKQDPAVKAKIEELKAQKQAEAEAAKQKAEAEKLKSLATTGSDGTLKTETPSITASNTTVEKATDKKEEKENEDKSDTYTDRSARNEVRQNLGLTNGYSNNKNETLVNRGYAINAQSKRTEQAIDNAANQINSIFQQNIDRINNEKRKRDAQEDTYYETALYRADQKFLKQKKAEEAFRKKRDEDAKKNRLSKDQAFQAKGGTTNYNAELAKFKFSASESMGYINGYLIKHTGTSIQLDPISNCSYVQGIEQIQKIASLSISSKDILINNLLTIREEYYNFYAYNSSEGLKDGTDYLGQQNPECGNYLDAIIMRSSGIRRKEYISSPNKFGVKTTYTANDNYGIHGKNNYTRNRGISVNNAENFELELKKVGIVIHPRYLSYHSLFEDKTGIDFYNNYKDDSQPKPAYYKWSDGTFRHSNRKATHSIYGNDIKKEIDLYRKFIQIKREHYLAGNTFYMSMFNYHSGYFPDAYNQFQEYLFLTYGSFDNFITYIDMGRFTYGEPDISEVTLLGAMLYLENKEYDKTLLILNSYDKYLQKRKPNFYIRMRWAVHKVKTLAYYKKGDYNKITFPDIKNSKDIDKYKKEISKDLYPVMANALIKSGNLKKAKVFIKDDYKTIKKLKLYSGTKTDIEAYKEVIKTLYPNDKGEIQFMEQPAYLIPQDFEYLFLRPVKGLFYKPVPLPTTIIDLTQNAVWKDINNNSTFDNREKLSNAFHSLLTIYKSGKLKNDPETELFLKTFIQYGIVLGNFYDVMPAILQLKGLAIADKRLLVQEKLITQMITTVGVERADETSKWFVENMSDSEIKKIVKTYLYDWSYFGTTSPYMPFLYSFY